MGACPMAVSPSVCTERLTMEEECEARVEEDPRRLKGRRLLLTEAPSNRER